jgi:hypothetical protein
MSDAALPRFEVVAEGITDFIVIEAVLGQICGRDVLVNMIVPEVPFGQAIPPEGSWTRVRTWCQEYMSDLGGLGKRMAVLPLRSVTALVIHVDADIAAHGELHCEKLCPPACATVDALRAVVLGWAGEKQVPDRVVVCIPSKAIEAWVLAALYPTDKVVGPGLECRKHPEASLKQKPEKLVSGKENHKDVEAYRREALRIATQWHLAHGPCPHAKKFHDEITALLP